MQCNATLKESKIRNTRREGRRGRAEGNIPGVSVNAQTTPDAIAMRFGSVLPVLPVSETKGKPQIAS